MQGWAHNYFNGSCNQCAEGCQECEVGGDEGDYTFCNQCQDGYSYNFTVIPPICSPGNATGHLQNESEEGSSDTGVIIGLSVWASVVTITAGVFAVLWYKKADNSKEISLLGTGN